MRTFNLVIQDVRFSAPTHEQTTARDRQSAEQIARRRLEASPYHLGVQVRDEEELLYWFRRMDLGATAQAAATL